MQQKVNESKTLFNKSFDKHQWEIHPSIIPFLIPIDVLDNEILLQVTMAPVNHNKLNQSKATQIAHTILGNAHKSEDDPTLANQDFGNNACVLVSWNDSVSRMTHKSNKVFMQD